MKYYAIDNSKKKKLIHYGVKGQKWGVRRYQYEDGTRTTEGREHYNYVKREPGSFAKYTGKNINRSLKKIGDKIYKYENESDKVRFEYGKEEDKIIKKYTSDGLNQEQAIAKLKKMPDDSKIGKLWTRYQNIKKKAAAAWEEHKSFLEHLGDDCAEYCFSRDETLNNDLADYFLKRNKIDDRSGFFPDTKQYDDYWNSEQSNEDVREMERSAKKLALDMCKKIKELVGTDGNKELDIPSYGRYGIQYIAFEYDSDEGINYQQLLAKCTMEAIEQKMRNTSNKYGYAYIFDDIYFSKDLDKVGFDVSWD